MTTAILRPHGDLDAIEAMSLRDNFTHILETGGDGVIVDLTGIQHLSAAGLAAVTNLLGQGRRIGIPVRVLPPPEGSGAALVLDQADLRRFIAPGGLWDTLWDTTPTQQIAPTTSSNCVRVQRGRWLRRRFAAIRRVTAGPNQAAVACGCHRPQWMNRSHPPARQYG